MRIEQCDLKPQNQRPKTSNLKTKDLQPKDLQPHNLKPNNLTPKTSYNALSTCSFICSSSSFICTTMFCISAWLDFEPVVFISRPIS